MNEYLPGAITWIQGRAAMLRDKLASDDNPPALRGVLEIQVARLDEALGEIGARLADPSLEDEAFADHHLASYRGWVRLVADFEHHFLMLCDLWREDEDDMQGVLDQICQETGMPPLIQPVIALHGAQYSVMLGTGIIYAPRMERHFLLHLPDLYHEIGHLLVERAAATLWGNARTSIRNHFSRLIREGLVQGDPMAQDGTYRRMHDYWSQPWLVELTCDAIATFLCGPAYAWAHLHLCASHDSGIYVGHESHPADEARQDLILMVLGRLGEDEQREQFMDRWSSFAKTLGQRRPASYDAAYPRSLLELVVHEVHGGLLSLGIKIYDGTGDGCSTASLLNRAWEEFWKAPKEYRAWEEAARGDLRRAT
jgi:hypothetical protein